MESQPNQRLILWSSTKEIPSPRGAELAQGIFSSVLDCYLKEGDLNTGRFNKIYGNMEISGHKINDGNKAWYLDVISRNNKGTVNNRVAIVTKEDYVDTAYRQKPILLIGNLEPDQSGEQRFHSFRHLEQKDSSFIKCLEISLNS